MYVFSKFVNTICVKVTGPNFLLS